MSKYQILLVMMVVVIEMSMADVPSCASKLVDCADYMNSTSPPSTCCTPLKAAIETELDCLCDLYNTPGLLQSFGINITQAQLLPSHCKLTSDLAACTTNSSAPSPKTASSSPPPPANDASVKITLTAFSGGVLLLLASTIISCHST